MLSPKQLPRRRWQHLRRQQQQSWPTPLLSQMRCHSHLSLSDRQFNQDDAPFCKPTVSDLNLAHFGRSSTIDTPPPTDNATDSKPPFCETPNIDSKSISNPKHTIGPAVENRELDKSNITIIGPTGSGKTLVVYGCLITSPFGWRFIVRFPVREWVVGCGEVGWR